MAGAAEIPLSNILEMYPISSLILLTSVADAAVPDILAVDENGAPVVTVSD